MDDADRNDEPILSGAATRGHYLGGNRCCAPRSAMPTMRKFALDHAPLYRESRCALNVVANSIKMKLHQELDLLSNANLRPAQGGGLERGDAADIRQRNGTFRRPFVRG
jgi:hypothetical protein